MICLLEDKIEDFKNALKSKSLSISDLLTMTTEKRIEVLKEYAGENAKDVNHFFETKLILKNKELGLKNALRKLTETGKYSPSEKARLDALKKEWKEAQNERIFTPKEEQSFLNSLANKITGEEITREEAARLFEYEKLVDEAYTKFDPETQTWTNQEDRFKAGLIKVASEKYFESLKEPELSIVDSLKEWKEKLKEEAKTNPGGAVLTGINDVLKTAINNSIALTASLDNSFLGRQGLRALYTHPTVWYFAAKNSFLDMVKTLKGEDAMDQLMADVYTRPNFISGDYQNSGLLDMSSEQFPSSLPERIPYLGRIFKASEVAFKGSGMRVRLDLYDLIKKIGEETGVDFNKIEEQKATGEMINSLTAKGNLSKENTNALKLIGLWAPRMLKSHIDILTDPVLAKSPFARKQATYNLIKILGLLSVITVVANSINPGSVETDPRSSDFEKIKVGNTRFDVTGGMASLLILASRLAMNEQKSTKDKKIVKYSGGFGQKSRFSAFVDFLTGKVTPPVGVLIDYMKGVDRNYEKPVLSKELLRLITPIFVQNVSDAVKNKSVESSVGVLTDFVGVSSNTYKPLKKDKK